MYNKVLDLCKVRNKGNVYHNHETNPTPRVEFITNLLDQEGIDFELDVFNIGDTSGYNIVMKGSSNRMVVAHHDIVNSSIDNANDNSASVINAIMVKKLSPSTHVVILDGEEFGGLGSQRVSDQILDGEFGPIDWVLNLELTGKGGNYFFIGNYPGNLSDHIRSIFDCPIVNTPFNDSVIFRKNGIDSCVINPLPPLEGDDESSIMWNDSTYLDESMLYNCHTFRDTVDTIDVNDMKLFTETIVLKILNS